MKIIICPKCDYSDEEQYFPAKIKQYQKKIANGFVADVIDVGFKCPMCNHEFGFDKNETKK